MAGRSSLLMLVCASVQAVAALAVQHLAHQALNLQHVPSHSPRAAMLSCCSENFRNSGWRRMSSSRLRAEQQRLEEVCDAVKRGKCTSVDEEDQIAALGGLLAPTYGEITSKGTPRPAAFESAACHPLLRCQQPLHASSRPMRCIAAGGARCAMPVNQQQSRVRHTRASLSNTAHLASLRPHVASLRTRLLLCTHVRCARVRCALVRRLPAARCSLAAVRRRPLCRPRQWPRPMRDSVGL